MNKEQLAHELAMVYIKSNIDITRLTPLELLDKYQETENEILNKLNEPSPDFSMKDHVKKIYKTD